jgi:hypothetical protein
VVDAQELGKAEEYGKKLGGQKDRKGKSANYLSYFSAPDFFASFGCQ